MFDSKGMFNKRVDEDGVNMIKRGIVLSAPDYYVIYRVARRNGMQVNDLLNSIVSTAADTFRKQG